MARTQFISAQDGSELGVWTLPIDPYPGDLVTVGDVTMRVIRRTINAYPKDPPWADPDHIDLVLTVREA